jgi:hypothetical protein
MPLQTRAAASMAATVTAHATRPEPKTTARPKTAPSKEAVAAAPPQLRSVFESDSDDEVGIADSIKDFFSRRASDPDRRFLDRAREWREEKRSKEPKESKAHKPSDDSGKWF